MATTRAGKPKRPRIKKPKPKPTPLYRVGDVCRTVHTVRVKHPGPFRRRYLYLLPGAEWVVTAVTEFDRSRPEYTLTCGGHTVTRREWRIRLVRRPDPGPEES